MLRNYQEQLFMRIITAINKGLNPLVVLSSGGGKTHLIAELSRRYKSLAVAHRKELLTKIKSLGDSQTQVHSIQKISKSEMSFEAFGLELLIIDEAHHACASTYRGLVKKMTSTPVVGFSATPVRLDGQSLGEIFDCLIEGPPMDTLIDDGWLADVDLYSAPDGGDIDTQDFSLRAGKDYSPVEQMVKAKSLTGKVVEQWLKLAKGLKTVVFCINIAHVNQVVAEFSAANISAKSIHSKSLNRDSLIDEFSRGEFLVLVNCEIATEGVDIPDCECVQIVRATRSIALFDQMVGRVLRPKPKRGVILDHGQNWKRFGHPIDPRHWSLDGAKWGGTTLVNCEKCNRVYRGSFCPSCQSRRTKSRQVVIPEASSIDLSLVAFSRTSQDERQQVLDLNSQGLPAIEIAESLSLPRPRVWGILRTEGRSDRVGKRPKEIKKAAIQLARDGVAYTEIAVRLDCSSTLIQSWAVDAGIKRRKEPSLTDQQVADLIKNGLTQADIKAQTGTTAWQIERVIKLFNLRKHKPKA